MQINVDNTESIKKKNYQLIADASSSIGFDKIPDAVKKLFEKTTLPELHSAFFVTFSKATRFAERKIFGTEAKNETFFALVHHEGKKLPRLFIHHPGSNSIKKREANVREVTRILERRHHMQLPEHIANTIREIDSSSIPKIFFDGSKNRFLKLAKLPQAKLYNNCVVKYSYMTKHDGLVYAWTIFIEELDSITRMAESISMKTKLDMSTSTLIAQKIGIDDYFGVQPVYTNAWNYAKAIARFLHVENGDFVQCLLQGELKVITSDFNSPSIVFDTSKPSVFLIPNTDANIAPHVKGHLYIFNPEA